MNISLGSVAKGQLSVCMKRVSLVFRKLPPVFQNGCVVSQSPANAEVSRMLTRLPELGVVAFLA